MRFVRLVIFLLICPYLAVPLSKKQDYIELEQFILHMAEGHSKPRQKTKMELYAKIVNG